MMNDHSIDGAQTLNANGASLTPSMLSWIASCIEMTGGCYIYGVKPEPYGVAAWELRKYSATRPETLMGE